MTQPDPQAARPVASDAADSHAAAQIVAADPDELIEPRVRQLLHRYAELAHTTFAPVGPDCWELVIPRTDRAAFGGRAAVRIALSLAALETDLDAEMAVLGSIIVEQLITAIRKRGTRCFGGDLVPTLSRGQAAEALPTPVARGTAALPATSVARHPVGRLIARIVVRAGTSLSEHLVESSAFDLTTGMALGADVATACEHFVAQPVSRATEASAEQGSAPSLQGEAMLPARAMDDLVPMMLGDLERRLAPQVDAQRALATKALQVELARIDRYYRGVLEDIGGRGTGIPDAASRRAIEREHARRRAEEERRHEVRATVHPVQLIEWTVPVERAVWSLASSDGHRAELFGQRTLVGQGAWVVGCPHCGRTDPAHFVVCHEDHAACSDCGHLCTVCESGFCLEHGLAACHVDGRPACDLHAATCASCRQSHCTTHQAVCEDGGHLACTACLAPCAHCNRVICDAHMVHSGGDAPLGARRLCGECARYCEGGRNEPVGMDEVTRCASCDRHVCRNHQAACAVDGKVHCSTHLRRTDRSRRLVCEHDRASCAYETHAVFAADEVSSCSTCGAVACADHIGVCFADGTAHCRRHLVPLVDQPGRTACLAHHTVCRVDGRTFSLEGTVECPVCAKRACASHRRTCPNCARSVCTLDIAATPGGVCASCASLNVVAEPPDDLLHSAVEALGETMTGARRWRASRDATHRIVELDLGWTRRAVLAVPHGQIEASFVVRHSLLGSTVLRAR